MTPLTPILLKLAEHAGAWTGIIAFIGGVLLFFGADLPPWAGQSRVEVTEEALEAIKKEELDKQLTLLDLQRFSYEQRLRDAKADLARNPNSESAAEKQAIAERYIRDIDRKRARLERGRHRSSTEPDPD